MQRSLVLLAGVCVFLCIFTVNTSEGASVRYSKRGDADLIDMLGRLANPSKSRRDADVSKEYDSADFGEFINDLKELSELPPSPTGRKPVIAVIGRIIWAIVNAIMGRDDDNSNEM